MLDKMKPQHKSNNHCLLIMVHSLLRLAFVKDHRLPPGTLNLKHVMVFYVTKIVSVGDTDQHSVAIFMLYQKKNIAHCLPLLQKSILLFAFFFVEERNSTFEQCGFSYQQPTSILIRYTERYRLFPVWVDFFFSFFRRRSWWWQLK